MSFGLLPGKEIRMLKRPMRSMAAKLMLAAALSLSSAFMAFAVSQDIIIH